MFWDNFYKACEAKGLKPTSLLKKLSLSTGLVTVWKKRPPNGETLLILADALDVSVDYLLGRGEPQAPATLELDPTTQVLVEHFNKLSPQDKIDILNLVLKKAS